MFEQLYQVEEEGCDSVPGGQGDAGPEVACRITDTQEKDEMFDMDLNLESFSLKLKEMEILLSVGRIDTKIIL